MPVRTALAVTTLAAAVAGCSASSGHAPHPGSDQANSVAATAGPDGVQRVTIGATDMFRFDPATITLHTGTLKVTLVDAGSYPHNLSVEGRHQTSRTVAGDPGQNMTTFTLRFTRAGTYNFECTFHSTAGMRGRFVVSPRVQR